METQHCPAVMATWDDLADFPAFIKRYSSLAKYGIMRVMPPTDHVARATGYEDLKFYVKPATQSVVSHDNGGFTITSVTEKPMRLNVYKQKITTLAQSTEGFWENLDRRHPMYVEGMGKSLFDAKLGFTQWNPSKCIGLLDAVGKFPGVNTPYCYIGHKFSFFALHVEDINLYSMRYLHTGARKIWYSFPSKYYDKVLDLMTKLFPGETCPAFVQHKCCLIPPNMFLKANIPVYFAAQNPGEYIITFPAAHHFGYNEDFNIAEAINFAMVDWVKFGRHANYCTCTDNTVVKIPQDEFAETFLKKYEPQIYKEWKETGKPDLSSLDMFPFSSIDSLTCEICQKVFKCRSTKSRHKESCANGVGFVCKCGKKYEYKAGLYKHSQNCRMREK